MNGLGYIKTNEMIVAREDHEYPDWLWGLLDKKDKKGDREDTAEGVGDEFCEFFVIGFLPWWEGALVAGLGYSAAYGVVWGGSTVERWGGGGRIREG